MTGRSALRLPRFWWHVDAEVIVLLNSSLFKIPFVLIIYFINLTLIFIDLSTLDVFYRFTLIHGDPKHHMPKSAITFSMFSVTTWSGGDVTSRSLRHCKNHETCAELQDVEARQHDRTARPVPNFTVTSQPDFLHSFLHTLEDWKHSHGPEWHEKEIQRRWGGNVNIFSRRLHPGVHNSNTITEML